VGNKADLKDERQVTQQEGEHLAQQWRCSFFEASAKSRMNVEESFFTLVRKIRALEKGEMPTTETTTTKRRRGTIWKKKVEAAKCVLY